MRRFDLDDLTIVQAVVTHGGVTRAAKALHRVPSNVTTRIKQLEARLGLELFTRRGRSLEPTEEGRLLIGYADRLLRLAHEADSALREGRLLGSLRLGSLESTAGTRLPQLLTRYNQDNPAVRIELVTGTTGALIGRLARHDVDAAFVSEPFHAPGLLSQPMFEEELVLVTAPHVRSLSRLNGMKSLTLIAFAQGCSYRRIFDQWQGEQEISTSGTLEFTSYPAIVACVAAGTGIAIVPRSVLAGLKAARSVRAHRLPDHLARNRTHLLWHEGRESSALLRLRELLSVQSAGG